MGIIAIIGGTTILVVAFGIKKKVKQEIKE